MTAPCLSIHGYAYQACGHVHVYYVQTHTPVCTYVCRHICVGISMHIFLGMHIHIFICGHIQVYEHTHVFVWLFACVYLCVAYTYVYLYVESILSSDSKILSSFQIFS